jgi:hypothetical protein
MVAGWGHPSFPGFLPAGDLFKIPNAMDQSKLFTVTWDTDGGLSSEIYPTLRDAILFGIENNLTAYDFDFARILRHRPKLDAPEEAWNEYLADLNDEVVKQKVLNQDSYTLEEHTSMDTLVSAYLGFYHTHENAPVQMSAMLSARTVDGLGDLIDTLCKKTPGVEWNHWSGTFTQAWLSERELGIMQSHIVKQ